MSHQKVRSRFGFLLYPLSLIYGLVVRFRNALFDLNILKSTSFDFPVICIGNITVGGTGKTPHVEYLLDLLHKKFNIAVLSRGYKRKTKGYLVADNTATPYSIGDEPYQLHKKFKKATVAVNEDRVEGIRKLQNDVKNLQGVILDDAFQHRYVKPGLNILLVDYYRPVFSDSYLPYGMLRDHRKQIHRANIVIVTKVPKEIKPIEKRLWIKNLGLFPYQYLFFSSFEYGELTPVFGSKKRQLDMKNLKEAKAKILLLSGIANPEPLKIHLTKNNLEVNMLKFPDHYNYTLEDTKVIKKEFQEIKSKKKLIITTEKDAVKLQYLKDFPRSLKEKMYYLPVKVKLLDGKQTEFEKLIIHYVKKNKEINRLYR